MNKLRHKILIAINDANQANECIELSDLMQMFRSRKISAVDISMAVEDLCTLGYVIDHDKCYDAHCGLEVISVGRIAISDYKELQKSIRFANIKSWIAICISAATLLYQIFG